MEVPTDADNDLKLTKRVFKDRSNENLQKLLEGKDKVSTQKATEGAMSQFQQYLHRKQLPKYGDLDLTNLPEILYNFYPAAKPIKGEHYSVQSLKCLRSGIARYYRKEKGFDITQDAPFVRANEMFKAVLVESKKQGKGVRQSTPTISDIDLERIAEYFSHDHMSPDPKKLQQQMIFYVIYFFCRRGRENLYEMLQSTYTLVTNPDGTQFVKQSLDEVDKNHGPDDSRPTNEGRMYPTGGKIHKYCLKVETK